MKTNLEELSPVKKRIHVEIDVEEVNRHLENAYKRYGKTAKIRGFRPGKIPARILKSYFGPQISEDVARDLISDTLPRALEETSTFPIGTPILEKNPLKEGEHFVYSAEMEVRPEFEVKNYLDLEVQKERVSVKDDDVDKRLEQIRKAHGKLQDLEENRPVREGDYVVLDYEAFEGEGPLEDIKAKDLLIHVGSHDFHPRFEASLVGLSKGERADIAVAFESDFYHTQLAGKDVRFHVEIKELKELRLPELDDAFARDLGAEVDDLNELKAKVRETIEKEEEKRTSRDLRRRLVEKIISGVDIALPETFVTSELEFAVQNVKQNLMRSGSDLTKAGLSEEKLREDFRPTCERRVKEMLSLAQIAEQEGLLVGEEDLEKAFEDMATETGQEASALRKYYEARDLLDSLRQKLLEEKTLNYLAEHAKISYVERKETEQENG